MKLKEIGTDPLSNTAFSRPNRQEASMSGFTSQTTVPLNSTVVVAASAAEDEEMGEKPKQNRRLGPDTYNL